MEIHFVHKSTAGVVAVVAVLVTSSAETSIRTPMFQELPTREDEVVEADNLMASPAESLPADRSYYIYTGSFTTPPCSEGVRWIVMRSPIQIHPNALAEHVKTIGANNRPVQPLHQREIQGSAE
jgi:carbonic anhydrase